MPAKQTRASFGAAIKMFKPLTRHDVTTGLAQKPTLIEDEITIQGRKITISSNSRVPRLDDFLRNCTMHCDVGKRQSRRQLNVINPSVLSPIPRRSCSCSDDF